MYYVKLGPGKLNLGIAFTGAIFIVKIKKIKFLN
jgi:hypothetical protein